MIWIDNPFNPSRPFCNLIYPRFQFQLLHQIRRFIFISRRRSLQQPAMMSAASPLSLICALLLCLPLAVLFTVNSPTAINSVQNSDHPFIFPLQSLYMPKTHRKITLFQIPSPPPPPPPTPPPEEDDLLFPLASRVDPTPSPTRKLAFMFLTNSPLPFAPLWELFFKNIPPDLYNVYIHADPTREYDPPFSGVFSHRVIPSKPLRDSPLL